MTDQTIYAHDSKGNRTDVHRPSVINPGDYSYIGVNEARKQYINGAERGGPGGVCTHCGKAIVWAVTYKHLPSAKIVTFGYICAGLLDLTDNRIDHEMEVLKRRAANEREAFRKSQSISDRKAAFEARFPVEAAFIANWDHDGEPNGFLARLQWGIDTFGSPLDGQVEALKRFIAGREKIMVSRMAEQAKLVNAPAITAGRYQITGTIIATKWKDSDYGMTLKMTVQSDSGNKVWGTVPGNLSREVGEENLKGTRVSFVATIKLKDGDDHFAFFSRPSNAKVVS